MRDASKHRLLYRDAEHCIGQIGNVAVWILGGKLDASRVAITARLYAHLSATCPDGYAIMVIGTPESGIPDNQAIRGISKVLSEHKERVRAFVAVFEGDGMWLVTARAIMRAFVTLARAPIAMHVSGDNHEAARWVEETLVDGPTHADLAEAIGRLSRLHEAQNIGELTIADEMRG